MGPQPANVAAHHYIPQATLLPHCQAAVINGGAGTMLGALATGLFDHTARSARPLLYGLSLAPSQPQTTTSDDAIGSAD